MMNSIHLVYVEYRLIFYRVQKKWTWPGSSALMWGFLEQIIFPLQNFMTKRWEIYCKAVQCNMFLSQPFLIFWPKHLSRPQVVALITEYWSENEEVALRNNILMSWSWSLFSPFHVWPHSLAGDGPHWRALCHQTSDNQVKDCQETNWDHFQCAPGREWGKRLAVQPVSSSEVASASLRTLPGS